MRAAIGSPVQQTNCHPFRHGNWLFVHNGYSATSTCSGATSCSRSTPSCSPTSSGSTDTEVVFHLALTLGLEDDPIGALERTVGLIEATGRARTGSPAPCRAPSASRTATTLWAVRYATEGTARTLFASADVDAIHRLYPDNARLSRLGADDRLIVSEPFADLPGVWQEIPQSSAVTVRHGGVLEHQPFQPRPVTVPSASGPQAAGRRATDPHAAPDLSPSPDSGDARRDASAL